MVTLLPGSHPRRDWKTAPPLPGPSRRQEAPKDHRAPLGNQTRTGTPERSAQIANLDSSPAQGRHQPAPEGTIRRQPPAEPGLKSATATAPAHPPTKTLRASRPSPRRGPIGPEVPDHRANRSRRQAVRPAGSGRLRHRSAPGACQHPTRRRRTDRSQSPSEAAVASS